MKAEGRYRSGAMGKEVVEVADWIGYLPLQKIDDTVVVLPPLLHFCCPSWLPLVRGVEGVSLGLHTICRGSDAPLVPCFSPLLPLSLGT